MIKKVSFLEMDWSHDRYRIPRSIPLGIVRKYSGYLNTGIIRHIDIVEIQTKTVWAITLTSDDDTVYTEPFKI